MSGLQNTCKRCGKAFSGGACPFCTVTGVDLEALLNAEEMKLLSSEDGDSPVTLVDMVSGRPFAVPSPLCKIGRDMANHIVLAGDRSMSRFHFQIRQSAGEYYIEDCGSRNGTFLNGSPIAVQRKLQNGDIVSAGVSRYRFTILSQEDNAGAGNGNGNGHAEAEQRAESKEADEQSADDPKLITQIQEAREAMQKLRGTVDEHIETSPRPGDAAATAPPEPAPPAALPIELMEQKMPAVVTEPLSTSQSSAALPWLEEYAFPELQKLMHEKERLNGLLEEIRQDIKQIDRKIASCQSISQALLAASGPELGQAVKQVFDALEWQTEVTKDAFEICLKREPRIEAVVRVVVCNSDDPGIKEFEALVNQQAVVWCQSNFEPKGIMIVQSFPEQSPRQRPALSKEFLESMRRKKICVIQATQLLSVYKFVVLNGQDKAYFKDMILNTCGQLQGFIIKPQEKPAATA